MEENNIQNKFDHYVGVKFSFTTHAYFFGAKDIPLTKGDKVVVETVHGPELGEVVIAPIDIEKYKSELDLKPIIRKATDVDNKLHSICISFLVNTLLIKVRSFSLMSLTKEWTSVSF